MNKSTIELIKMLLPLIVINYAVVALCLWMIFKKGVRNLNKWIWASVVVLINTFGPIGFLLLGRKTES